MRVSRRELIMLVLLIILAIFFIEYRFVIQPNIGTYQELVSKKQGLEFQVQEINVSMAAAKNNEVKRV